MPFANVDIPDSRLDRLLDRLELEPGSTVMLHTAFGTLENLVDAPATLIERLTNRLGPGGTLLMPRYGWHLIPEARPWLGYAEYLRNLPPMDLRSTPANIGVVPDSFRKLNDVEVSISHFWPISGRGPAARKLLSGQAAIDHAFGPDSVFARLVEHDVRIVGLGVTLNTTSVAPVTDWHLGSDHHRHIFTDRQISGMVVDLRGRTHFLNVTTMLPEAVRDIKPSRILNERLRPGTDFPFVVEDGSFFFSYQARLYHETALSEGQAALRQGRAVPWLS
jgi:aminoglycoside N3'-acetyltransferase